MPAADAADLVRRMAGRYRLPDALRRADSLARAGATQPPTASPAGLRRTRGTGMSAQCRYQADTYIHAGWSTDLGVAPEVGGAVLNTYVAAATRGVRSLALIS
jgi:hypothetical protein